VTHVLIIVVNVLLIIPAIILHEVSHGYMAYFLGDPTAKNARRLTLNPLAHVDLYGTIILPLLMLWIAGFAIGYAKPVPINPNLMRRTSFQNGLLLTGAAGPVTNVLLALASGTIFRLLALFGAPEIILYMFGFFTFINLVLAFFNLIPIPPLDGSRVVQRFLHGRALEAYHSLERWGILIVLAVAFILPTLIGVDILGAYIGVTVVPIADFIGGPQLLNVVGKFLGA
jgi:Zn-dependent protease